MKNLYLLADPESLVELEKHRQLAPVLLAGYQALWHPLLLADAELPPKVRDVNDLPTGGEFVLVVPEQVERGLSDILRKDLKELPARVLNAADDQTGLDGPQRILAPLELPAGDPKQLGDFFALGFAYLCLDVLFKKMGHDNPIDDWSLMTEVRQAAELYKQADAVATQRSLQTAFELLLTARQTVYPATINWVDLSLFAPDLTLEQWQARMQMGGVTNLLLTGRELDRLAERYPDLVKAMHDSVATGQVELVGGPYDDRSFPLLPAESRYWQLATSATAYEKHLGRTVDCYGSRGAALTFDLPQLLMKFQYRYALHAAFDGGKLPHFKEAKLHWTAPDGSVIEALDRVGRDATDPADVFLVMKALATTLMHDRSATMVLVHWVNRWAPWYEWLLRTNEFAELFGKIETFSDYFLHSSLADRPTTTRLEEYDTNSLSASVARGALNPIGFWVDHYRRRGRLDAVRSLAALHQIATGESPDTLSDLEDQVEKGNADVDRRLDETEQTAIGKLAAVALDSNRPEPGYLIANPCSFARRLYLEFENFAASRAIEPPLRGIAPLAAKTAVIVDVPAWGYTWLPCSTDKPNAEKEVPATIAKGKRLRNEYIELEIDTRTGGVRGIWQLKSGYSRIGQQLFHSSGSQAVCDAWETTLNNHVVGEIRTRGKLKSQDGRKVLASFEQSVRLCLGKPVVEISLRINPVAPPTGSVEEDYFAARWAWPDEKTQVVPASGASMQIHRGVNLEAPVLIELRERKLFTDILTHGVPFHRRIGYRMMDSMLVVKGESRREFRFSIAFDVANPWTVVQDASWPAFARRVEHPPVRGGRTGWFAGIDQPGVLCTRMIPVQEDRPGVQLRLFETAGKACRAALRFSRNPDSARLVNARGQLIFDLHVDGDSVPVDLSPHETLQVEVLFAQQSGEAT